MVQCAHDSGAPCPGCTIVKPLVQSLAAMVLCTIDESVGVRVSPKGPGYIETTDPTRRQALYERMLGDPERRIGDVIRQAIYVAFETLRGAGDGAPAGFLLVGTNERGEVVINLDHDRTGHIVFSPEQARGLACILQAKADEASS